MRSDFEIREGLKKLRSRLAYMEGNKHSYSFSDEELESIVRKKPKDLNELGELKGFPKNGKRVKAYGNIIVAIVNNIDIREDLGDMFKNIVLEKSNSFSK